MKETIIAIIIGLYIFNLMLPVMLAITDYWTAFVLRADMKGCAGWYQRLKYCPMFASREIWNHADTVGTWFIMDVMVGVIVTISLVSFIHHVPPFVALLALIVAGSPFIVRGILDIGRTLRMNWKTGDSQRLAELEQKLKDLEGRK